MGAGNEQRDDGPASIGWHGKRYEVRGNETVLEALLRQGAAVSYSCRRGSCQTCIMKCDDGTVVHAPAIDVAIERDGHILCCVARAQGHVELSPPDPTKLSVGAELVERRALGDDIIELSIAPMRELNFRAGQHLQVVRGDGLVRPYSIVSRPGDDYFFKLHVRRIDGGEMSVWLSDRIGVGDRFAVLPPCGDMHYAEEMRGRPLLLLATGTGAGALMAIAADALASNHDAPITLYHGVRRSADLYLDDALRAMASRHENFSYVPCVTGTGAAQAVFEGRVTAAAFSRPDELVDVEVFLCGLPAMVDEGRFRATLAGVARARIHADPFDYAHPPMPRDADKLRQLRPDPELWEALERGPGLTRILDRFYTWVYADERLSPFFIGVPKSRAIEKQYEFLAAIFSEETDYLGMNPFNAHHWMVISDELFDYRERLFERAVCESGLAGHLVRRWLAMHEFFRSDIVKAGARGLFVDGAEQPVHTHVVEYLDIDAVCDNCGSEIPAHSPSRYIYRIGALHCAACAGLSQAA